MPYLTVGEVAEKLGCPPKTLSDMLYLRRLDISRCPLLGGRRMIPADYVPQIERLLNRKAK